MYDNCIVVDGTCGLQTAFKNTCAKSSFWLNAMMLSFETSVVSFFEENSDNDQKQCFMILVYLSEFSVFLLT